MMIIYWILVCTALVVAAMNALGLFSGGHVELSASTILAPVLWLLAWSSALVMWNRYKRDGALKLAGKIALVTASLLGAVFGGLATTLGLMAYFNYGVSAEEVAREHYVLFALAGALAILVGLIFAGIAAGVIHLARHWRRARTPITEE
jgi:hypothetical protein